jgi:cysteine desulfuration protein SufE
MVKGCQSNVWLVADLEGEKVKFKADSDAAIVKGLIGLLMRVYDEQHPDAILSHPPDFIKKIGMQEHLSATRANGLAAMIKQMKIYAMAFKTKLEKQAKA